MKAARREHVDGTEHPRIHIVLRMVRDAAKGGHKPGRIWWAQYTWEGKQQSESLQTPLRSEAIRKAHALQHRLQSGDVRIKTSRISVAELVEKYLETLESRGRARTTMNKYRCVLRDFAGVCERGLTWKRDTSPNSTSTPSGGGAASAAPARKPSTPTK